VSHFKDKGLA